MDKIKSKTIRPFAKQEVVKNLKLILQSTAYCTLCFDTKEKLFHLDQPLIIEDLKRKKLPVRQVLKAIFGNNQDLYTSNYICMPCKTSAYNCFAFINRTTTTALVYAKYINQLEKETAGLSAYLNSETDRAVIVLESYENIEESNCVEPNLIRPDPIEHKSTSILRHILTTDIHDYCGSPTVSKPHSRKPKHIERKPIKTKLVDIEYIEPHSIQTNPIQTKPIEQADPIESDSIETSTIENKSISLLHSILTNEECDDYVSDPSPESTLKSRRVWGVYAKSALPAIGKAHSLRHRKEEAKKYTCDGCGNSFLLRSSLITHLKTNVLGCSESSHCPHCAIRPCVHEEYILTYNQQKQAKTVPMTCICGLKFGRTLSQLVAHVNMEHLGITTNVCEECGKHFHLVKHYKKHFYKQHKKFVCKSCSVNCENKKDFETHRRTCNRNTKVKRNEKRVRSKNKLNNQSYDYSKVGLKFTPGRQKKVYKCLLCDTVLKTRMELRTHINNMHEKKPNSCLYCNKQYDTRQEYLNHIQSEEHKNNKNVPYNFKHRCSECNYSTNTLEMLKAHINKIHLNIRPFECEQCHKNYFDSKQLRLHLKIHTGEREPKVCDICGAHLSGPTNLKKHRRLHTGENPYACPYCDVKTVCSGTLRVHIMRKHTEANIKCPLCDRKFHTMNNARGHVRKTHWKSKEKFDYTKLKGLTAEGYEFFRDKRKSAV